MKTAKMAANRFTRGRYLVNLSLQKLIASGVSASGKSDRLTPEKESNNPLSSTEKRTIDKPIDTINIACYENNNVDDNTLLNSAYESTDECNVTVADNGIFPTSLQNLDNNNNKGDVQTQNGNEIHHTHVKIQGSIVHILEQNTQSDKPGIDDISSDIVVDNKESEQVGNSQDSIQSTDIQSTTIRLDNRVSDEYTNEEDNLYDEVKDPEWKPPEKKRKRFDPWISGMSSQASNSEEESDNSDDERVVHRVDHESDDAIVSDSDMHVDGEEVYYVQTESEAMRSQLEQKMNTKEAHKQLRMKGFNYLGVKKNDQGKKTHCVARCERLLAERQCSNRCNKMKNGRNCKAINETSRRDIFNSFWRDMNWDQKRVYVIGLVEQVEVNRRTTQQGTESRRKRSVKYFLRHNEHRIPVCKGMFLSTLGINEKMVYLWVNNANSGIPKTVNLDHEVKSKSDASSFARQYLVELPKVPSHYCSLAESSV